MMLGSGPDSDVSLLSAGRSQPAADEVRISLLRDVLRRFGRVRVRLNGTSMLPAISPGELVTLRPVDPSALRAGDIVLVEREGRLFCHRLRGLLHRDGRIYLRTRGDYLSTEDPAVPVEQLLGRVDRPHADHLLARLAPLVRACARLSQRPFAWWVRRRQGTPAIG